MAELWGIRLRLWKGLVSGRQLESRICAKIAWREVGPTSALLVKALDLVLITVIWVLIRIFMNNQRIGSNFGLFVEHKVEFGSYAARFRIDKWTTMGDRQLRVYFSFQHLEWFRDLDFTCTPDYTCLEELV